MDLGVSTPSLSPPGASGFQLSRGVGSVTVNADGSINISPAAGAPNIMAEGHLLFSPDNTYDIGASGATRPRDFFLGRNAAILGTLDVTGNVGIGAAPASAQKLIASINADKIALRVENLHSAANTARLVTLSVATTTRELFNAFAAGGSKFSVSGVGNVVAAGTLVVTGVGSFGTTPALEGSVRIPNAVANGLYARNNANTESIPLIHLDVSDGVVLGESGISVSIPSTLDISGDLANGALSNIRIVDIELTALSGASVTATGLIPAGAFIIGITARVTTAITGAADFDIGDGTDVDRWGAAIAIASGTTAGIQDYTAAGFGQFSSANDVVLTANGANFTAGAVRITVHYLDLTPPTS